MAISVMKRVIRPQSKPRSMINSADEPTQTGKSYRPIINEVRHVIKNKITNMLNLIKQTIRNKNFKTNATL